MTLLRTLFFLLIPALAIGPAIVQADDPTQVEITGRTMGPIQYKVIVAHHPESVSPEQLQEKVQATLDRVNALMSTYIPDSDVSRFNNSDSTDFHPVDPETARVVARAIDISKQTDGAFDITVGPAVDLWNFGPGKKEFQIPSESEIDAVRKTIGFKKLSVRNEPPALRKSEPGLRIDLSAIAKGYAVDQVARVLDDSGCLKFMVEVGGEVFTRGQRLNGGKWRIAIERPNYAQRREIGSVAEISDLGMATSGDYRNFIEHDGQLYSHTIDPVTCRPVTHSLASACVIAEDCMTADALATAIMVLGAEKGAKVCDQLGVLCLTIDRDKTDKNILIQKSSAGFPLKKEAPTKDAKQPVAQSIWPTFLGATVVFVLVIVGMAVGSIFANKPVRGSCGGLANMSAENGEEGENCSVCAKPTSDCVEKSMSGSPP